MTWKTEYPVEYRKLKEASSEALEHHAAVSFSNNHYCEDCYCCACLDELRERKQVKRNVIIQRRETP